MVGVATAKTPCGPYTYKSSFKPLGADSRDESVFQDGKTCYSLCESTPDYHCHAYSHMGPSRRRWVDSLPTPRSHLTHQLTPAAQTSYLLYASDNNQNFKISQLDTNYYNVTTQVSVMDGASLMSERVGDQS